MEALEEPGNESHSPMAIAQAEIQGCASMYARRAFAQQKRTGQQLELNRDHRLWSATAKPWLSKSSPRMTVGGIVLAH